MGIYSIVVAALLGAIIILNETTRKKETKEILEIMTFVNIVYLICFSLMPILIYFYFEELPSWTYKNDISEVYYLKASIYSFIAYIAILISYTFFMKNRMKTSSVVESPNKVLYFSLFIAFIGWIFLAIFVSGIGGINNFFVTNTLYRGGEIEVSPVAFTRNLALFIPIASYMMFYYLLNYSTRANWLYWGMFILHFTVSLAIYFNRAGRLSLLIYIISFILLYSYIKKKKLWIPSIIVTPAILWFILYGKSIFNFFIVGSLNSSNNGFSIEKILGEFVFPFYTLANAVKFPFYSEEPRLFSDFLYGVLNLLPSAFVPFDIPATVTMLNTKSFGNLSGIPIDLVSLGFQSFGLAGILIISTVFGFLIAYLQRKNSLNEKSMLIVFYIQFLFFIALRIPYAEPTNFLKSNFALLTTYFIYLILFKKRGGKNS